MLNYSNRKPWFVKEELRVVNSIYCPGDGYISFLQGL